MRRPDRAALAVLAVGLAGIVLCLAGRTLLVPDAVDGAATPQETASRSPLPAAD